MAVQCAEDPGFELFSITSFFIGCDDYFISNLSLPELCIE